MQGNDHQQRQVHDKAKKVICSGSAQNLCEDPNIQSRHQHQRMKPKQPPSF
ncbi:hypothetical protein A2U01_0098041, partial [Trifolium medium]|nr:hypothetical protein [Trifolium medium]